MEYSQYENQNTPGETSCLMNLRVSLAGIQLSLWLDPLSSSNLKVEMYF